MGAVLTKPVTSQLLQRRGNKNFKVGSSEMQGYRMAMEDKHCIAVELSEKFPDYGLFGVFDGHAGTRASIFLEEVLHKKIAAMPDPTSHDALRQVTVAMDAEYCSRDVDNEREDGSTCCYCVVKPGDKKGTWEVIAVNVGDSRAMIVKPSGAVVALTEDHKCETPAEGARIRAAGGEVRMNRVDGQLAMSRAIGDWQYKSNPALTPLLQKVIPLPDIQSGIVEPGDVLLVCCDGIVEQMSNEDAAECVKTSMDKYPSYNEVDAAVVIQELLKYSLQRGSKDNHSALLIQFQDGTSYQKDDEFIAGVFHPYIGDRSFEKAYLADALSHGYSEEEAKALAKKTEAENPHLIQDDGMGDVSGQNMISNLFQQAQAMGMQNALGGMLGGGAAEDDKQ